MVLVPSARRSLRRSSRRLPRCSRPAPRRAAAGSSSSATGRQLAQALHRFERDDRWWDREEEEREELWALASARHTEEELQAAIAAATDAARDDIRSALAAALPTGAFADPRLSEAALAAALLAVHHRVLALLADAPPGHPFFGKHALFAAGRWPLGCLDGRYHVF